MTDMLRQLAELVLETRPSIDLTAARERGYALAPSSYIAQQFQSCLGPLSWFDEQFTPMLGIDIRAVPELAANGIARRQLEYADVLIIRYENLTLELGEVARFRGLSELALPARNVTSKKDHATPILPAVKSFRATDLCAAFERELRNTDYGRACGYDQL